MTVYENLVADRASPTDGPTMNDVLAAETFTVGVVSLDYHQEIEPHPEPYEVFFLVLGGAGEFTSAEGTVRLTEGDGLYLEAGERRGIRCIDRLTILGVQEAHDATARADP